VKQIFILFTLLLLLTNQLFGQQAAWHCIGPDSTGIADAGIITCLYVDPADSNFILAGSNSGGLWRTTDGGTHWLCITDNIRGIAVGVHSIAVHPKNRNIIFIGLGVNSINRGGYSPGVYSTLDGGAHWKKVDVWTDGYGQVFACTFSPDGKFIYKSIYNSIFRSNDTGRTWKSIQPEGVNSKLEIRQILFVFGKPGCMYFTGADQNGFGGGTEIWFSNNYGDSWKKCADFVEKYNALINGNFTQKLNAWHNAGINKNSSQWRFVMMQQGDHGAALYPAAQPQYLIHSYAQYFTKGCRFEMALQSRIPAHARLRIILTSDKQPDPSHVNPNDTVIYDSGLPTEKLREPNIDFLFHYNREFYYQNIIFEATANSSYDTSKDRALSISHVELHILSAERASLSVDDSQNVYALYNAVGGADFIVRTSNSGESWQTIAAPQGIQANYWEMEFAVVPSDNKIFYEGDLVMHQSTDTGNKFYPVSAYNSALTHCDLRALVYYRDDINSHGKKDIVFTGTDGGVMKKSYGDKSFHTINGNLNVTQFFGMSAGENFPQVIAGGTQDNDFFQFNGKHWHNVVSSDAYTSAMDISNPKYVFGGRGGGGTAGSLFLSSDSGKSWFAQNISIREPSFSYKPLTVNQSNHLFYIGFHNLYVYRIPTDYKKPPQGFDANKLSDFTKSFGIDAARRMQAFDVNVYHPEIIIAAMEGTSSAGDKCLFITKDNGKNWKDITKGLPVQSFPVYCIKINTQQPNEIWVGMGGISSTENLQRVFYTDDGGQIWQDRSAGLTSYMVNCFAYYDGSQNLIFAGTDAGIFVWNDNGQKWNEYHDGFPSTITSGLFINYNAGKLQAATFGRGIWETEIEKVNRANPVLISKDTTISASVFLTNDLKIQPGVTLQIRGTRDTSLVINLPRDGKIILAKNAKLIASHVIFTNSSGAGWNGIFVANKKPANFSDADDVLNFQSDNLQLNDVHFTNSTGRIIFSNGILLRRNPVQKQ
jgi:photosystem II stability/assembly factor-like uncharacterized protein